MIIADSSRVIQASLELLQASDVLQKQLIGEPGLAEEETEEYRRKLTAVLLAWIAAYSALSLSDDAAVATALVDLEVQLDQLARKEFPNAFKLGFGTGSGIAQAVALAAALNLNSGFLISSLLPYIGADLSDPEVGGLTLGQLADDRGLAWASRVGLYTGAYWTAVWLGVQESMRESLQADTVPVRRLLDPGAQHCATCPPKAREHGSWNEMLALTGRLPAAGPGPCHCITTSNSRVLTNRGQIPIRDVVIGDQVLTHRGRWRTVLETIISFSRPIHRQAWLLAPSGEWIGCTSDHRWLTQFGWQRTDNIANKRLSVYTLDYASNLYAMRDKLSQGSPVGHLYILFSDLPLWKEERLSRGRMSELRHVPQSQTPMAERQSTQTHPEWYPTSWNPAQEGFRRSKEGTFPKQEIGRTDICSFLGWREEENDLPLSMGMDGGTWIYSERDGYSSRRSRSDRRSLRELKDPYKLRTRETSSPAKYANGSSLRHLRKRILETTSEGTPQQVLLTGALLAGTPLYDLRVEEDHSFIVEGLISHNSNCRCQIELFLEDEW